MRVRNYVEDDALNREWDCYYCADFLLCISLKNIHKHVILMVYLENVKLCKTGAVSIFLSDMDEGIAFVQNINKFPIGEVSFCKLTNISGTDDKRPNVKVVIITGEFQIANIHQDRH